LAHDDLNYLYSKQEHALAELQHFYAKKSYILNAHLSAYTQLTRLKKVYKRIHFKEYHFIEQSLHELEAEEAEVAKTGSIPTVVETAYTPVMESLSLTAHLSPLTNLFFFNFFFS